MLKQSIETKDLDGNTVVEDFYFNLTEAELIKLHLSHEDEGGMEQYISEAIRSGKGARIIAVFEELTSAAYGRRSDNNRLIKKPEWFEEITATEAYSEFFMKLVTDAEFGSTFVNNIMPPDLMARAREAAEQERTQGEAKGISPKLVVVDEAADLNEAPAKPVGKNVSKQIVVAKMMIKAGKAVVLHNELVDALTAEELQQALDNGSTLP